MVVNDWWGWSALAWILWILALIVTLWVVLYRLDKKLRRAQRIREAKACGQALQAMEKWRLNQDARGASADTKTQ